MPILVAAVRCIFGFSTANVRETYFWSAAIKRRGEKGEIPWKSPRSHTLLDFPRMHATSFLMLIFLGGMAMKLLQITAREA